MKVLVSLTVLAIVGTATALECFSCNSGKDSACTDDFHSDSPALREKFVKNCTATAEEGTVPFCRKIKTYISQVTGGSVTRIMRDCGTKKREGKTCYQKRSEDYIMDTCQCDTELCNGAPSLTTSLTSVIALVLPFFSRFL